MNIYVGNLNYNLSEDELRSIFEEFGEVTSAKIIIDKYSGRSKGFGFVEMSDDEEANAAIEALNDKDLSGRNIKVNKAREKTDDRRRNFR
jgi:RNA recognition motif-containing protein